MLIFGLNPFFKGSVFTKRVCVCGLKRPERRCQRVQFSLLAQLSVRLSSCNILESLINGPDPPGLYSNALKMAAIRNVSLSWLQPPRCSPADKNNGPPSKRTQNKTYIKPI